MESKPGEGAAAVHKVEKSSETVWSEEFMQQASVEFERNIRMMMAESASTGEDTDLSESLFKVSQEAAAKVFENQPDQAFGASFADTLRYLAEGTESLQVQPTCSCKKKSCQFY